MSLRAILMVAAGGAVGTAARYGLDGAAWGDSQWPWSTFVVNIVGSFLLGVLAACIADPADPRRLLLGTGLLGGFTTYSAFAVQTDLLLQSGDTAIGLLYSISSVALGLIAAVIGLLAGPRRIV